MSVSYAIRVLLRSRGASLLAVLTLAFGIGANTAIFSVVRAVLLRPLPYRDPNQLVTVLLPGSGPMGAADYLDLHRRVRSLESSGAAELWGASLTGRDAPQDIVGMRVTEDLFRVLGTLPVRGRLFDARDFTRGNNHVLIVSYGLWQREFAGDPGIAGRQVLLNGAPYTVVGVMPRGFYFAPFWVTQAEMWAPLDLSAALSQRGGGSLRVFARLAPGMGRASAQAEADTIASELALAYPAADTGMKLVVESLPAKAAGNVRLLLQVLLGVVGMVLVIACANVANLSLARATARTREVAVRLALGAGRATIALQFLTESVVLSLAGGAVGMLLAQWGVAVLRVMLRPDTDAFRAHLQQWDQLSIDAPVLLFALGVSTATGLLFGLAPAFAAVRCELNDALKQAGRAVAGGGGRLRRVLMAGQVGVALALLIGTGLLTRSFISLRGIDPGFDPHNVAAVTVSVAGRPDYAGPRRDALYQALVGGVSALPGVIQASMTNHLPIAGDQWRFPYWIEGQPAPARGHEYSAVYRSCRDGYFATMRSRILAGRDLSPRDSAEAPLVAIVNQALARRHFDAGKALGARISFTDPRGGPRWMTVVGVVQDIAQSWAETPAPEIYVPYWQDSRLTTSNQSFAAQMTLVVRTAADAAALLEPIKRKVWSIDRELPLSHVETLEHAIGNATWQSSFALLLAAVFSSLALALAAVGVYGVMAYDVTRRLREIGIRIALGARGRGIVRWIVAQTLPVALAGVVAGLALAAALVRLLRGLLFQVEPMDPLTFGAAAAFVLLVALAAGIIPARRAVRVSPVDVLRGE